MSIMFLVDLYQSYRPFILYVTCSLRTLVCSISYSRLIAKLLHKIRRRHFAVCNSQIPRQPLYVVDFTDTVLFIICDINYSLVSHL